jgi:lantibiotic modifying enzyme
MHRRTAVAHAAVLTAAFPSLLRRGAPHGKAKTLYTAADYRAAALGAERFVRSTSERDKNGVWWPLDPGKPSTRDQNLYSGSAGVVLMYLELHAATGEQRFLDEAREGVRALLAAAPTSSSALGAEGAGLYTGTAGTGFVLQLVHERAPSADTEKGLKHVETLLTAAATAGDGGTVWNDSTDIVSGTSGIALTMAALSQRGTVFRDSATLLESAGRALIGAGRAAESGKKWGVSPNVPRLYPNFSHGTAGVGYALATLAVHPPLSSNTTFRTAAREAAIAGAAYLASVSTRTANGGRKIFHSEPGGGQLFYMSWCHGPPGTARFYRQLARVSGDSRWLAYLQELSQGVIDSGVPDTYVDRSGFWNNISQCCGSCGVAEYFIVRARVTRSPADLAFAQRVMDNVISRATTWGDGLAWAQAENRTSPETVIAQTGYMQGAAGVAVALLHLEGAMTGREPSVVLPDTPAW